MNGLSNSGAISFSQIKSVYGMTGALSMSLLYRDGDVIPWQNTTVPVNGRISTSNLLGSFAEVATSVRSISGNTSLNTSNGEFRMTQTSAGQVGYVLLSQQLNQCGQCFSVSMDIKARNPITTAGDAIWLSVGANALTDDSNNTVGSGVRLVIDDFPTSNLYAIYHGNTLKTSAGLGFTNANNTWRRATFFVDLTRGFYRTVYGSFDQTNVLSTFTPPGQLIFVGATTGSQSNEYMIRNVSVNVGPILDDTVRNFPPSPMTNSNTTITNDYGYSGLYIASNSTTLSNDEFTFGGWRAFDSSSNTTFARSAYNSYNLSSTGLFTTNSNWISLTVPSAISLTGYNYWMDANGGGPVQWCVKASNSNDQTSYVTLDSNRTAGFQGQFSRRITIQQPGNVYKNLNFVITCGDVGGSTTSDGTFRVGNIQYTGYDLFRNTTSNVYDLGAYNMSPYNIQFSNTEARWIHTNSNAQTNASTGNIWMAKSFYTASNCIAKLHIVADKQASVYINDGFIYDTKANSNTYQTQTFVLPAGSNNIYVNLSNYSNVSSGLLLAIERPNSRMSSIQYQYMNRWVLKSDTSWVNASYPRLFYPPTFASNVNIYNGLTWSTQSSSDRTATLDRWRIFSEDATLYWNSGDNMYDGTTKVTMSNTNLKLFLPFDGYFGEWICLNCPYALNIYGYDLNGSPERYRIYASTNGSHSNVNSSNASDWFVLDERNEDGMSGIVRSNVISLCTSNIYRLAIVINRATSPGFGRASIYKMKFYGYKAMPTYSNTEFTFSTPGTYSWTVPTSVTKCSAICVGGGGGGGCGNGTANSSFGSGGGGALSYKNNISVTPGETLTIVVGAGGTGGIRSNAVYNGGDGGDTYIMRNSTQLVLAKGGGGGQTSSAGTGGAFSACIGDGGGSGGNGQFFGKNASAGGGGAGGYFGDGGSGGTQNDGQGGGGGGGTQGNGSSGGGGGGVGLYGEATSGLGGLVAGDFGGGGAGGTNGAYGSNNPGIAGDGGLYGGGGGATDDTGGNPQRGGNGGRGAVRITCKF